MMIASMAFFAIEDLFLKISGPVMPRIKSCFVGYGGALAFALWALAIRTPLFNAQTWDRLVLIRILCDFFGAAFFILAIVSIPFQPCRDYSGDPAVCDIGRGFVFERTRGHS